ncbi:hypothetical protein ACA910_011826 [Epithemia clementina (nom. ined.)]
MVISTSSKDEDPRYLYRPQRSPQTKAIVLKSSNGSMRATTPNMRCSPQKSPQHHYQKQQHQQQMLLVSPFLMDCGSSAGDPSTDSPEHKLDTGMEGDGKGVKTVRCQLQLHQNGSDSSLSSSHSRTHPYHNGHNSGNNSGTNVLPGAAPIRCAFDDTSKKRRRRIFNCPMWNNASIQQKVKHCALAILFIWQGFRLAKQVYHKYRGEQLPPPQTLDFLVAGFPKSGTTTLLATLREHPQIAMDSQENCQIARPIQQDDVNLKRLNRYLFALKNDVVKARNEDGSSILSLSRFVRSASKQSQPLLPQNLMSGIKCPDAVKNFKAIHRLSQHSPDCKFIIGVRHPIFFLQSFYNYRVLEAQTKNRPDIPSLYDIWERNQNWWDISPDAPRYELFLSQFGKTEMSLDQLRDWMIERPMLAVKPNRFRIFLYTLEQVEDVSQGELFRRDLQSFLGLSEEIQPFGHENKISNIAGEFKDSIDICSVEYNNIRSNVLQHALTTVQWMHKFLESPDVVVSNRTFLMKQINDWTKDPCEYATVNAV